MVKTKSGCKNGGSCEKKNSQVAKIRNRVNFFKFLIFFIIILIFFYFFGEIYYFIYMNKRKDFYFFY